MSALVTDIQSIQPYSNNYHKTSMKQVDNWACFKWFKFIVTTYSVLNRRVEKIINIDSEFAFFTSFFNSQYSISFWCHQVLNVIVIWQVQENTAQFPRFTATDMGQTS